MTALVDMLRALMMVVAQALGGSVGAGIVAVSLALRVVLLPLTIRLARRSLAQQRVLKSLAPDLGRLNERFRTRPDELQRRTLALYERAGYRPVDGGALLGNLAQIPILGAMYQALRSGVGAAASFLWIADLARPDALLAIAVAALGGAAALSGNAEGATRAAWFAATVGALITLAFCWHASAGLVLSWGASAAVNGVQGLLLKREQQRIRPA